MKKVWVIARNTFKEIIRDRILYGLIVFALLLIGLSLALGQLTFSEQERISTNFGLMAIQIGAVMLSIFLGGTLVTKEVDKKTILTLLVRPLSRSQLIYGKALGLLMVIFCLVVSLSSVLLLILFNLGVAPKAAMGVALWGVLLESIVLLGITLFFSTFMKSLLVSTLMIGVFIIGHWVDSLNFFYQKSSSVIFKGTSWVILKFFPNLEAFNWRGLVTYNDPIDLETVVLATSYSFAWFALALSLSQIIIRRRDFV